MTAKEFHVLVVGAGNCGLAIATGLKKAGISYTVFEQSSEGDFIHKTHDWGMLLHWSREFLEKVMPEHLRARMGELSVDPFTDFTEPVPYLNGLTGEVMGSVATPGGVMRISRRKLRNLLWNGQNLHIEFDKRLRSVSVRDDSVTLAFDDGISEAGSVVVGADGAHSKVREFLVGVEKAQPESAGETLINYAADGYSSEQVHLLRKYHPILKHCVHPVVPGGALMAALDIPDPNDTTNWKFQIYTSWPGPPTADDLQDPAVRVQFIKERMSQFCEPFQTAFLALSDDALKEVPVFPGAQWAPTMKWNNHNGKVTLAGDAAHSMLPHRGQGLNNAIKDASEVVDAIKAAAEGSQSLSSFVEAYEDEMRARGAREVALSYETAKKWTARDLLGSQTMKLGYGKNDNAQLESDMK